MAQQFPLPHAPRAAVPALSRLALTPCRTCPGQALIKPAVALRAAGDSIITERGHECVPCLLLYLRPLLCFASPGPRPESVHCVDPAPGGHGDGRSGHGGLPAPRDAGRGAVEDERRLPLPLRRRRRGGRVGSLDHRHHRCESKKALRFLLVVLDRRLYPLLSRGVFAPHDRENLSLFFVLRFLGNGVGVEFF